MEGDSDERDPAELLKDLRFVKDGGFSVRLLFRPSRTRKFLDDGMDVDTLAIKAVMAGADVDSPVIPTKAVKLALGKHLMEREGEFPPDRGPEGLRQNA